MIGRINAQGADLSHSLGPVALQGGHVSAVENTAPSPGGLLGTRGTCATGAQYRRQLARPWYLAKETALSVGISNSYFNLLGLPWLFEEAPT